MCSTCQTWPSHLVCLEWDQTATENTHRGCCRGLDPCYVVKRGGTINLICQIYCCICCILINLIWRLSEVLWESVITGI